MNKRDLRCFTTGIFVGATAVVFVIIAILKIRYEF